MFAHTHDLTVELNLRNALSNIHIVGLEEIGIDFIR
jgi:hypothetical protein